MEISGFDIMSSGDCNGSNIICMGSSSNGDIRVWSVDRQLEKCATFNIKTCEKNILKRHDAGNELDINLNSLCVFKKQTVFKIKDSGFEKSTKSSSVSGTRIVAGINCTYLDMPPEHSQAFEKVSDDNKKCFLVVYAVTEAFKSASAKLTATAATTTTSSSSSLSATANGNANEAMNSYSNPKNGSSLITILESSYEERLDGFDDILKFMDNKETPKGMDSMMLGGPPQKNNTWTFLPKACDTSEMDSVKSINVPSITSPKLQSISKQSSSMKTKPDSEVICFPIQTIEIANVDDESEIKEIYTSCDNHYIIVVIKSKQKLEKEGIVYMETDENTNTTTALVRVLVYEIDDKGLLKEDVVCERIFAGGDAPIEFSILPKFDTNGRIFSGSPSETNSIVVTCMDGSIKVLSITSLMTLSEARVPGEKFISSVYCKNLERLCACTENATLHFYSFYDLDNDSSDELEDEMVLNQNDNKSNNAVSCSSSTTATNSSNNNSLKQSSGENDKSPKLELIAHKRELNITDLKVLYSLTLFDEMLTPFSAEVPVCWTELIQAKRRQNMNGPGEDNYMTRTWRLHNDATTWDEHLIELSLPKTTSVGHIDFKFSILQPCSNPPAIQVTLLKQKSIGLCCRRKPGASRQNEIDSPSIDVDNNINFNLNSSTGTSAGNAFYTNNNNNSIENPVLSEEYLQARNAEILVGPIELSSCMDLNEQGGTVSFISPKLLKSKARNYLIHLKTMTDVSKDGHAKTRGEYFIKNLPFVLYTHYFSVLI